MASENEGRGWFAPKRFGYGAGLPIAWQGWAVLAIYFLILAGSTRMLERNGLSFIAIVIVATALLILIVAKTTRGGWRWRWGEGD